jgi:hypothetical protein
LITFLVINQLFICRSNERIFSWQDHLKECPMPMQ